jgi:two-component system response regulator DevR
MASLPLTWEPDGLEGLLPRLDANLELGPLGEDRTQLAISARYRPPLGVLGQAIDRVLLHRMAEATLKDFLDRLGAAITLSQPGPAARMPHERATVAGHAGRRPPDRPRRHQAAPDRHPRRGRVRRSRQHPRGGGRGRQALPDVVVMDVRLSDGSGIEATRDIRAARPHTSVLMLTSYADDEALFASIMAGAAGYVLKQIRGDELVRAIRAVGAGQSLLDPAVTRGVFDRLRKGKHLLRDEQLARLSAQEEQILGLVAEGRTNGQIGTELGLAEKTVKNDVSSILAKLEVARRAEAAAYLARHTTPPGSG